MSEPACENRQPNLNPTEIPIISEADNRINSQIEENFVSSHENSTANVIVGGSDQESGSAIKSDKIKTLELLIKDSPFNYDHWINLIQESKLNCDTSYTRSCYDRFLERFPTNVS
ncbi:hypothetical protein AYI69_g6638 [Smittium culicis]|uniref:Uncharacterized protein n=1 Tax=Smittium culicis TaxID=133412 RepID=A0A1R1XXP4_9FUNG|nr:hypothetical protein AYI69_g6638 [Smittium culicis]